MEYQTKSFRGSATLLVGYGANGAKCFGGGQGSCGCGGTKRTPAVSRAEIDRIIAELEERREMLDSLRREVKSIYIRDADLADRALEAAERDLDLPPIRIRYFADPKRPDLRGYVHPDEPRVVWLSADLKGPYLVKTLGHELRHVKDLVEGRPPRESAADEYGHRLVSSDWSKWPRVEARWY